MQIKPGTIRFFALLTAVCIWTSCDPTDEKKKPEKPAEPEKPKMETVSKGVLSDSLYTLVVDVTTFGKFKNNVAFNLLVDTFGKVSLVGWNPPFPKPGTASGSPVGTVVTTDSAVARITTAISISSLFLQDKKKIDDAITANKGKYVVFVPNVAGGKLGYDIYVSGGIPGVPSGTNVNFLMAPTGTSLNPSPPYSDQ